MIKLITGCMKFNRNNQKTLFSQNKTIYGLFVAGLVCAFPDLVWAALTNGKEAIEGLQQEIFAGPWIVAAKIAAPVVGLVMSLRSSSVLPLASTAGITAAIHFFQKYTEGAAALLIP